MLLKIYQFSITLLVFDLDLQLSDLTFSEALSLAPPHFVIVRVSIGKVVSTLSLISSSGLLAIGQCW